MRARIENVLAVKVEGVNLSELRHIEFYVRQGSLSLQYTPQILDSTNMLVKIPFDDAKKLLAGAKSRLQFAFTDNDGNDGASDIYEMIVQDLIKPEGYDYE